MSNTDMISPAVRRVVAEAETAIAAITGGRVEISVVINNQVLKINEDKTALLRQLVCAEFDVSWHSIAGPCRQASISDARKAYCLLNRQLLGNTLKQIGMELNRDHTSIIHNVQTAKKLIQSHDYLADYVNAIKRKYYESCR